MDVADPGKPSLVGRVATGGQARGLVLEGDMAYVASGSAGLVVVDVSTPAHPRIVGRAEMPGGAIRVDYSDGRVYVAAWNDARVYDVSAPAPPRFIGAVRMTREIGTVRLLTSDASTILAGWRPSSRNSSRARTALQFQVRTLAELVRLALSGATANVEGPN